MQTPQSHGTPEETFRAHNEQLKLALRAALSALVSPNNPLPDVIDLFGYDAALEFLFVFGGRHLYVPKIEQLADTIHTASTAMKVRAGEISRDEAIFRFAVPAADLDNVLEALDKYDKLRQKVDTEKAELLKQSGLFDLINPIVTPSASRKR